MCEPTTMAVMMAASEVASTHGKKQAEREAYRGRRTAAQAATANAKKAMYDNWKDLTARALQDEAKAARQIDQITSDIDKKTALESTSAGEHMVKASVVDNIRARLEAGMMSEEARDARATNVKSAAEGAQVTAHSRINQAWSQVGVRPSGWGLGDFMGIGTAAIGGYATGKMAFA